MQVLVVGSGGREHALCWSFLKSPLCTKIYCAPGNPGISALDKKKVKCLPGVKAHDIHGIIREAKESAIDFVMVGPEIPLTLGLVDALRAEGIPAFGPTKAAAALEGSKGFMKDLCKKYNIPTAAYERFTDPAKAKAYVEAQGVPIVIKADGLAAGKGVTIAQTIEEAFRAIDESMVNRAFGESGQQIVIEEFMVGEEASFFALTDGETAIPFTTAQDHKAAFDGDKGPNTGGMGAYSPAPNVDEAMSERVMREIINPTVQAMKDMGSPFTGMLYAGLMITAEGPKLIEYNVRFGDPETQVMLPRLKTDLLALLFAVCKGVMSGFTMNWYDQTAVCVVMAAQGYPGEYAKGSVIKGLDEAAKIEDGFVFHAGTAKNEAGEITAAGGRVLCATAWGDTIKEAQATAYKIVEKINWPEGFCRRDIGWRAIERLKG